MEKKYLTLNDITSYKKSFLLSNYIWTIVISWDTLSKQTIGSQYIRAIDSISSNIAEGFGRYGKKDKVKFYYYSFGSLKESFDWNEKAKFRKLLTPEQYSYILEKLRELQKDIHHLIKFTNEKFHQ